MTLAVPIIFLCISLFLTYQGLCYYGVIKLTPLVIKKFLENNTLSLVRVVLSKYLPFLGLIGLILGVALLITYHKDKEEELTKSYWLIFISYFVIAIFSII